MTALTYESFWNMVLGADRSPERVIAEFDLDPTDRVGLDAWLGEAVAAAAGQGADFDALAPHHEQALAELCAVQS